MIKKNLRKDNGFTIIEVLIVLAIAGLILLIVFLAVPALQRNARNTSRKTDAAALAAGVNEYLDNNNGTMPTACSGTTTVTLSPGTVANANMGYYNASACSTTNTKGAVSITTAGSAFPAATGAADDFLILDPQESCSNNALAAGSARQFSVLYEIETGSNTYAWQCIDS